MEPVPLCVLLAREKLHDARVILEDKGVIDRSDLVSIIDLRRHNKSINL